SEREPRKGRALMRPSSASWKPAGGQRSMRGVSSQKPSGMPGEANRQRPSRPLPNPGKVNGYVRSFVISELLCEHQCHLRQLDSENVYIQSEELLRGDDCEGRRPLRKLFRTEEVLQARHDAKIEPGHLTEGDIKKMSAAARGLEYMEIHEVAADFQKLSCVLGCVNAFTPRVNDSRPHDALNVGFGCEMPSKGMTLVFVHAVLKQRTEDRRIDLRPVLCRCAVLPSH